MKLGGVELQISQEQIREMSWLGGGQFVTLLLSFISIKVMTTIGPNEYGKYILAMSIVGMLALAFFGPLEQGFIRFYFEYARDDQSRKIFLHYLLRILTLSFAVLSGLGFAIVLVGSAYFGIDVFFYAITSVMIIIAVSTIPLNGMMNAMRLRRQVSILQVGEKLLVIFLLLVMGYVWYLDVSTAVLCICIATGLTLAGRLRVYHQAMRKPDNYIGDEIVDSLTTRKSILQDVRKYSLPFLFWGAMSWLQLNGERWVINDFLTSTDVGRYGLAASVVNNSVVVIFNVITLFVTPIVYNKFSENTELSRGIGMSIIRFYSWITFFLFLLFAGILYLEGDFLIQLVSTKEFILERPILLVLTLGLGVFYVAQAMTSVGLAMQQPGIYLIPKILTGLLSIIAYIVGCYSAGIFGVVVAMFIINSLYLFLVYQRNARLMRSFRPAMGNV